MSKWEVLELGVLTKLGEECLHISANNIGNGEFELLVELERISDIDKKSQKFYHYTRLGKIVGGGYIPFESAIAKGIITSKLVQTAKGSFMVLIKREMQERMK